MAGRSKSALRAARQRAVGDARRRLGITDRGASAGESGLSGGGAGPRKRTDVRLALPAVLVWGAAVAGLWLAPATLLGLCIALLVLAAACLMLLRGSRTRRNWPAGGGSWSGRRPARRSFLATTAVGLLLAVAAAAHSSVASSQRFEGPLAEAVAAGKSVVAVLEVGGAPRPLPTPGQSGPSARWSVAVWTREVSTGGVVLRTRAQLIVTGGNEWAGLVPGQTVRAAGKLRPPDPGRPETGGMAAATAPDLRGGGRGMEATAKDLRAQYVAASAFLPSDAAGLLPGMVTGDTSALDEGLANAMKTVGMTHLTAVSGANCSLVLGALLAACRRLRLARVPAAGAALTGLGLFVVLVGPDASVLRAALMGAVGIAALAGGRTGRGLSFLCLAVIALLLLDPALGGSFGFLLSVLATLGIILLGRRIMDWTPAAVPRWAAAAVAVPLSAQMLCGPVIVLLQPQFATFALLANVAAAPLVAPVTLLGTAAVPLLVAAPWMAVALIAVAGSFSVGVAATAWFFARLPGSTLPWPEGIPGLLTMAVLSALTLAAVWAVARPRSVIALVLRCHRRVVRILWFMESRSGVARRPHGQTSSATGPIANSFAVRPGRGRLEFPTHLSGRNPPWLLRKSAEPARRRRIRRPGGT
ncbi:ComEC/Rec2 family competence protein [Pseudarthrobacter chlorophenolicus]|uniref:ComEC/Rec2 family competence protein n=1 Tax=Pseudarthrobacter chlorophenolicus TaxID=85085 RepID=UPI0001666878|nr:ComEC/Rec2 family competence protein [Pseudarthrobacter chlorophenolicus]